MIFKNIGRLYLRLKKTPIYKIGEKCIYWSIFLISNNINKLFIIFMNSNADYSPYINVGGS